MSCLCLSLTFRSKQITNCYHIDRNTLIPPEFILCVGVFIGFRIGASHLKWPKLEFYFPTQPGNFTSSEFLVSCYVVLCGAAQKKPMTSNEIERD